MITYEERIKLIDYLNNNKIDYKECPRYGIQIFVNNTYVHKLLLTWCKFTGNYNTITRYYLYLELKGTSNKDCDDYKYVQSINTILLNLDEMIDVINKLNIVNIKKSK